MHVQAAGRQQMTTGNVLASMFREKDSHAVYLLEKQGVSRFDVINYISHGVSKVESGGPGRAAGRAASRTTAPTIRRSPTRWRAFCQSTSPSARARARSIR